MVLRIVVVASLLALCGCRTCWYHGKAVPPSEAQFMKNLGMDVRCSDD
jgi:uncharacterized protein YdgA (DUF945 family)